MKSKTTALLLSIFLGGLGVDRFYLGYTGIGILKLLSAGCFGILTIIDVIMIATGKLIPADGSAYEEDISNRPQKSVAEELISLKGLLDDGIISQQEFDEKKRQILR